MVFRAGWISALALLLAASLTGKLLVGDGGGATDDRRLAADLSLRLADQGFATSIDSSLTGLIVRGTRGACRLAARDGAGWPALALLFEQRAAPYGSLHYLYRGGISRKPPRLRPGIDRVTNQIRRAVGAPLRRTALLVIAVTPACDTAMLARLFDGVTVSALSANVGNSVS